MIPKYVLPTVVTALSLGMAVPALSGEGHDHGDTPAVVNSNGPQRLPDGGVFLPKPAATRRTHPACPNGRTAPLGRIERQGGHGSQRRGQSAAVERRSH